MGLGSELSEECRLIYRIYEICITSLPRQWLFLYRSLTSSYGNTCLSTIRNVFWGKKTRLFSIHCIIHSASHSLCYIPLAVFWMRCSCTMHDELHLSIDPILFSDCRWTTGNTSFVCAFPSTCSTQTTNKPFSPTKGKDHVKTSIKLGNQ